MLDIMATFSYYHACKNLGLIILKESLSDAFFDLKSGFAGDILQKFSNYQVKLIIVGDFSEYTSKSLHAFIRECNRGNQVFFLGSVDEAIEKYNSL